MQMTTFNFQASSFESEDEEDNEEERTLFCANLDEKITEELLYELFLQAGPLESVRIPKDPNGRQRTFGFITYVHKNTVPYAMHLYQGLSLYRKPLTIKYKGNAQPSPMRNFNVSPANSNRSFYDNTPLRVGNYTSFRESPPQNPFHNNYSPDYTPNSSKYDQISKHASSQRRPHTKTSPYQRKSGGGEDRNRDRERDYNKRRSYNNGSNRHSDQRPSGKGRR